MHAQVETGSEGSSPRTPPARRAAANGNGAAAPPQLAAAQLSDWRLKAALSSREEFQVRPCFPCLWRMLLVLASCGLPHPMYYIDVLG